MKIVDVLSNEIIDKNDTEGQQYCYNRNSPKGNCIAFHWVHEVLHHPIPDKPVKRLDNIQDNVDDDKKEENQPIMHMYSCNLNSMGSQRMSTKLNFRHFCQFPVEYANPKIILNCD
uniref:Uncharacterized protein n=1 Tax=Opuntia streptacantha TaxID=393608 RepID=A0A7C9EHH9_OPUST